jgi:hypothetical protein
LKPGTVHDRITTEINKLNTYVDSTAYLNQERIFAKLTNDGKNKGIYAIGKDNEIINFSDIDFSKIDWSNQESVNTIPKIVELYINASYIATGILKSTNWEGKVNE